MAPGKIINGGPGVKAQMLSMKQKGQYADFIEIFGKQVSLETANKAEVAGIFQGVFLRRFHRGQLQRGQQKYKGNIKKTGPT